MTAKKPAKKKVVKKVAPVQVEMKLEETETPIVVEEKTNGNGSEKYFYAIGRRKESVARVRLFTKKSSDAVEGEKALIVVNGKDYTQYFSDVNLQYVVESPLKKLKKSGLLTRDPRVKERRKYGHKKARKSGQFSKR